MQRPVGRCPLFRSYYIRHHSNHPLLALVSATITIQRALRAVPHPIKSFPAEQAMHDTRQARISLISKFILDFEAKENAPVTSLTREERSQAFTLFCTRCIQHAFRVANGRRYRALLIHPIYSLAARCIITHARMADGVLRNRRYRWAAHVIQNRYRGMAYRRVFLGLKDYIMEVTKQTASSSLQLLRHIDPIGAKNIEALAADFVIRFRFGAPSDAPWPPRIYWKVFLRNQYICDVLVTAPRNYCVEQQTGIVDRRLWYHRITNSPWRLLDLSVVDSIVQSSAAVMRPAFHSKDEIERLKHAKRLTWMKELRKLSILQSIGIDDLEKLASSTLQQGASSANNASGVLLDDTPTEIEGSCINSNAESIEDLLQWSKALDYDKYSDDWLITGVTFSQRELDGPMLADNSEPQIPGIPGHTPGRLLRYSSEVLKNRIKNIDNKELIRSSASLSHITRLSDAF